MINTLDTGVLTSKGFVKVKPTLEVQGHPGVFAIGDIIDWPEQKQAAKAPAHAATAAANVASFLNGAPLKSEYKGSPEAIIIPIGKVRTVVELLQCNIDGYTFRTTALDSWASCGGSSLVAGWPGC